MFGDKLRSMLVIILLSKIVKFGLRTTSVATKSLYVVRYTTLRSKNNKGRKSLMTALLFTSNTDRMIGLIKVFLSDFAQDISTFLFKIY